MPASWSKPLTILGALIAVFTAVAPPAHGQQAPTTVLVVRHAEKAWEDGDPPLSDVGWERAEALLRVAEESGISVLFATQYARTQQTLEPIASSPTPSRASPKPPPSCGLRTTRPTSRASWPQRWRPKAAGK